MFILQGAGAPTPTSDLMPIPPIGDYFYNGRTATNTGSLTLTPDVLRAFPFLVTQPFTSDQLVFSVATASTGSVVLGIYNNNNFRPSSLNAASVPVSTDVAAVYANSFAIQLSAGIHWLAYNSSSPAALRALNISAQIPLTHLTSLAPGGVVTGVTASRTYDGSLPAVFPAAFTFLTNSPSPIILLRRSA